MAPETVTFIVVTQCFLGWRGSPGPVCSRTSAQPAGRVAPLATLFWAAEALLSWQSPFTVTTIFLPQSISSNRMLKITPHLVGLFFHREDDKQPFATKYTSMLVSFQPQAFVQTSPRQGFLSPLPPHHPSPALWLGINTTILITDQWHASRILLRIYMHEAFLLHGVHHSPTTNQGTLSL